MTDVQTVERKPLEPRVHKPQAPTLPKNDRGPRLHVGKLKPLESAVPQYYAQPPAGTPFEAILRSDYWAHYTKSLVPGSEIRVMPDDGAWYAWLLVVYVSPGEVKVEAIYKKDFEVFEPESEDERYKVEWAGPAAKFRVRDTQTNEILRQGFYPKDKAHQFVIEHKQKMR